MYPNKRRNLWLSLCLNITSTIILLTLILLFSQKSSWLTYGWSESLNVIGININTKEKYIVLIVIICTCQITQVIINEVAMSIIGFTVYNPYMNNISEFKRYELDFLTNSMYLFNNLRNLLSLLVSVSQMDIALIQIFVSQIVNMFIVYYLLGKKTFVRDGFFSEATPILF